MKAVEEYNKGRSDRPALCVCRLRFVLRALPAAAPVSAIVSATVPARADPDRTGVWWASPVAGAPEVAGRSGIVVAINPGVAGTGVCRPVVAIDGTRRCRVIATDAESDK